MTEKSEKRKKIYQVAKEINISHETLIAYLVKRGHEVSSHMSSVTDAMMTDIHEHFKKDREVAEKHQKKIQTIRDTRKKTEPKLKVAEEEAASAKPKKKSDVAPEVRVEPEKPVPSAPEPVSVPAPPAPEPAPVQEPEVVKKHAEEVKSPAPAEIPQPDIVHESATQPPPVEIKEEPPIHEKPAKAAPPAKGKDQVMPRRVPKMGLTIKGKIDLDGVNKANEALENPQGARDGATSEPEKKKKKKKKRVVKEKAPPTQEEADELLRKSKKKKKLKHHEVDQEEVKEAIKRTLAEMDETAAMAARAALKRKRKEKRAAEEQAHLDAIEKEKSVLKVTEFVSVNELATLMNVPVAEVIKKCIGLGLMVSINQRLDKDTITLVSDEFHHQVSFVTELTEEITDEEPDLDEQLAPRPPVVTIMGHVDHGKTSLLDYIRESNVVAGEAGGITQHIGAYNVLVNGNKRITFLDTPGHEAFTAMRARGAQVTDIVVLVVAADDNVMPQTVEAISHAQAAGVPIVIAMNKTDKAEANPDRIKQQLADRNVLVEEWGGKYQCVEISARTGKNIDLLLEKILLEAEVLDLKANPDRLAAGVVIEAQVDKGKGVVATLLIQKGTLRIGDPFVAGIQSGRVRAMFDERGNRIEAMGPSMPAQILGFDGVPQAGDVFICTEDEREARDISLKRQQLKREQDFRLIRSMSLDDISKQIADGQVKELKVIVKGDVDGSVGALADSLMKIQHSEVRVNAIHRAVGAISENDVLLAAASGAVIIGFHVRPNLNARRLAEQEHVDIRLYNIIYDAINDVKKALEGLLAPEKKEEITATIEIRDVFKVPKVGAVAGCYVQDGKIARGNLVRIIRDGIQVYEGGLASLRRFKDDVREVESGFECGIGFENFNDVKPGDIVEAFKIVETQRKLS
jgi:translation initiation factor IF-2